MRCGNTTTTRYYNFVYQPYYDSPADKTAAGIFGVAHDVTEQVRARQKTEESSEALKHFKLMADQARDPFILMREDGSFAYLNSKALEAWGYTKEEAEHLRVPDVDALQNGEGFDQLFALAQGQVIPPVETMHRRKDGQIFSGRSEFGGATAGRKTSPVCHCPGY